MSEDDPSKEVETSQFTKIRPTNYYYNLPLGTMDAPIGSEIIFGPSKDFSDAYKAFNSALKMQTPLTKWTTGQVTTEESGEAILWNELRIVWKKYLQAKKDKNEQDVEKYSILVDTLQHELGIPDNTKLFEHIS